MKTRKASDHAHRLRLPNRGLAVLAVVIAIGLGACGGFGTTSSTGTSPRHPTEFRLDEWSIRRGAGSLNAGRQTITATNDGHQTHELVIVRAADAIALPTKPDGSVDEAKLESVKVGELADIGPGASKSKTFTFTTGSYVAFCNVVDTMHNNGGGMGGPGGMMRAGSATGRMGQHVHFALGMHTDFTVQ